MLLKKLLDDDLFLFFSTALTVLISRLSFLLPGYGFDPDAWGVAFVSRQIANTGTYYVSRFPGYPVQELFYSLIWQGGPLLMNGMTALLSGLAAAFFALSMKRIKFALPFFSALVFAFIPLVYVNSVTSIDYIWALCFVLGSLYFVLSDKPVFAGLLLGLAIGTRISSGLMLLPLGSLWIIRKQNKQGFLYLVVITFATAGLCFMPVFLKYGMVFLAYPNAKNTPLLTLVKIISIDIWGLSGSLVLLISIASILIRFFTRRDFEILHEQKNYLWVFGISILLFLFLFFILPLEAGYLMPMVPFVILLLNRFMGQKRFLILGIGLICSSFFFGVSWVQPQSTISYLNYAITPRLGNSEMFITPFTGPILQDHFRRIQDVSRVEKIIAFGNQLTENSLIIVGWDISKFAVLGMDQNLRPQTVQYSDLLSQKEIGSFQQQGYKIYYLPELLEDSKLFHDVDLQLLNGIPISIK